MLESILRILALTRKELLAVLKDRRSLVTLLVPPILQSLLFGYAMTYDLNDVPYAVLDLDRSGASRELTARLEGSPIFRRTADPQRPADLTLCIDNRRALVAIQIDQDFERRLMAGEPADVQVIADGRNSNTAATATAYVASIVDSFTNDWRIAHGQGATPVKMTMRAWYNPTLETRWMMLPSLIGTLTLLQTLLLTAMSVAREREQGTFDQLLVTPFRPAEIMAGKALPSILIGLAQATNILLVAQLWFRIPFAGSFVALYVGMLLFLLAAVGVGLLLSSLAATMQQALLYTIVLMMPFIILSGLITSLSSMPRPMQYFTLINPLRYVLDIVRRVYLEGAPLSLLTADLWPLAVIAAVTLSAAAWMFRHRLT